MIKAIIFDLDGTLIQTEILKANSYALAINVLTKDAVSVKKVLDGFTKYVGLSRTEVVIGLVEEFIQELRKKFVDDNIEAIQQRVLSKRLSLYNDMINDNKLLSKYFCPFNLGLLHAVHNDKFLTVLATMSNLTEVEKVLDVMGIREKLDFVITRDNVSKGKPDPEIYLKAKNMLHAKSNECLVIEDSVNGIKAGLNAGLKVFAVTNNITQQSVHASNLLTEEFIIDDNKELKSRVYGFIKQFTN
jgi:beta-phosphoglucomutase